MKLTHNTFGTGTVISQDGRNIMIDFDGDVKTLVIKYAGLIKEDGTPFAEGPTFTAKKNKGQKRRERDAKELTAFNSMPNLDKLKNSILGINGKIPGDRNSLGYQIISEQLAGIYNVARDRNNTFVMDVIDSIERYMRASERQAFVVAKFADENGIKYGEK